MRHRRQQASNNSNQILNIKSSKMSAKPVLHIYEHCPFCTRARMALGYKGVEFEKNVLAADDVSTPTSLVGRKLVPIFQPDGIDNKETAMGESLDIVHAVDNDPRYGPVNAIKPKSDRKDIDDWISSIMALGLPLMFPRFSRADLPDFPTQASRNSFEKSHALGGLGYDEYFKRTAEYVEDIESKLKELGGLIFSPECVTEGGFCIDDILLYPLLRALTIVKQLHFPPKVQAYIDSISSQTNIPTHSDVAL